MVKKILAVSGGVDSMVMLNIIYNSTVKKYGHDFAKENIIIAHFEHGIRGEESKLDLEFVKKTANQLGLRFEFSYGNLGENTSEAKAREVRYDFLRWIATKHQGIIYTAHHLDDLVETVIINLKRGTGWRGLAPLDSEGTHRIFLSKEYLMDKQKILAYAKQNNIQWREDSTNKEEKYLRNRIRKYNTVTNEIKKEIYKKWLAQKELKKEIELGVEEIVISIAQKIEGGIKYSRNIFKNNVDEAVLTEVLRKIIWNEAKAVVLNKRLNELVKQIKLLPSGKKTQIAGGINIALSKDFFWFDSTL